MQNFKTITKKTTDKIYSVHYTQAHKVLENAQKLVANLCLDYDSTGSIYYCLLYTSDAADDC